MSIDVAQLAHRLPDQRWFGGKGRNIERIEPVDEAIVDDGPPALVLLLARVVYDDGGHDFYHLPLLVEQDGGTRDAFEDVDRLRIFGDLMAHGHAIKGEHGAFDFGGPGLDPLSPPGSSSARGLHREQTNTSLVLDERVILKVFRRVEVGPNPDLEVNRLLTNDAFVHIPPQVGEISYEGEIDGEEVQIDLGIAQQFIHDASEGWEYVLRHLHRFYDEIHEADAAEDIRFLTEERASSVLHALMELGNATASLHVLLGRDEMEPDLAPERVDDHDLAEWADGALVALRRLLTEGIQELEDREQPIVDRIERLRTLGDAGLKTRVHGDYHLGQVLLTPKGWMLIDFEGEPARPLEERRRKQSPLRDVAGMLRSFSYAALATLFERAEPDSDEWRRLLPWAEVWEELAREHFISAYLRTSHEGKFIPGDRDALAVMLDVFEIDKALYELGYERGHRPDWVRIPLKGIIKVLERGESN